MQYVDEDGTYAVDTATGEVLEDPAQVMDLVVPDAEPRLATNLTGHDRIPFYLRELDKLDMPQDKKAKMLVSYIGAQPSPLTEYLNQEIELCGAILYSSGRYVANIKDAPPKEMEGYDTILLKTHLHKDLGLTGTAKKHKKRVILVCSGKYLAQSILPLLESLGWFDWSVTINVVFTQAANKRISIELVEEEG